VTIVDQLARWADTLCRLSTCDAPTAAAALDVDVEAPAPFTRITLGEQAGAFLYVEVELGHLAPATAELDARFGPSTPVMALPDALMTRRRYRVEPAETPAMCSIYVTYQTAVSPDARPTSIALRRDSR
jgi:hypothetical protein